MFLRSWPNGFTSKHKLKTCVYSVLATPFGHALVLTCNDLHSLWSRSNLHTSQCKFFTVWPPNPLVNVSYVTSINLSLDSEKQDMSALKWFSHDLCILARKLVSPFGHPTQVQLAATRGYQWQPVTTGESVWPGLRDVRVKILQLCFLFETFATLR